MPSLARNSKQTRTSVRKSKETSQKKSTGLKLKLSARNAHVSLSRGDFPTASTAISFAETRVLHDLSGYRKAFAIRDRHLGLVDSPVAAKKRSNSRRG